MLGPGQDYVSKELSLSKRCRHASEDRDTRVRWSGSHNFIPGVDTDFQRVHRFPTSTCSLESLKGILSHPLLELKGPFLEWGTVPGMGVTSEMVNTLEPSHP